MGCGSSSEEAKKSKETEKMLEEMYDIENNKIKLLLLGAGESGKSTIFKQMKVLYGKEPTRAELMEVKPVIHANIINTMKAIISEAPRLGTDEKIVDQESKKKMLEMDDDEALNPERGAIVKKMWTDPGVLATWDLRAEYQVVESISKFFDEVDVIAAEDYCPTSQHMLTARVRTSGIVTESYVIDGNTFEMYDVGGQRNERKKWIHCFDNVTAVIFVGAISEYNQKLFEDTSTNRMKEALDLYDEVSNNRYFEKSSMLLFLNKKDLFEEKIAKVPIQDTPDFADYTGGADYKAGCDYFIEKFRQLNKTDREFYYHLTCATDTSNVKMVFNTCKDIILKNNLKDSGFL
uniref:Uncharacterized protein n=1 Tax=Florenciella parvula TaxID=236787 RepID=A0A7S2BLN2_9STRA|mmetsp:Transcript_18/g.35  ORF Transcript_18/g.35 Transcript_18/m.35 type:complete len:348 (+) Transcript_18:138-1181(+)|eukprot:CAMPEP_0182535568 /NCGR_PEP_ID=MMETSP1323-20130603/18250_1 /TAXON_ID=236787 /ORGANISM="Florenciella parvula, Strain RCC1693" /LENGTH=347 /DNA_ID=CAMNT_0024745723 /DNA_START=135 /DNA_END=1178 /DNA_ORIENTATION=+